MYLVKTDLRSFSAAHRLVKGYVGKCSQLHGHDYRVNLLIGSSALNHFDMVVDFDDIKTLCDDWVQTHLDHSTLLCEADTILLDFVRLWHQKYYVLPKGRNASAEAIAEHLFEVFVQLWQENRDRLNPTSFIHTVEVWESQHSGALFCNTGTLVKGAPCGV